MIEPDATTPRPKKATWLVPLVAYFVLHGVLRLVLSDTLDLDEAEQMLLSQEVRLGYNMQPPLYTWLQTAFFAVLGRSVLGLTTLKNLLLLSTYLFTYGAARQLGLSSKYAIGAALSLLMIPQVAWESQRDLSHSVLATTCGAALFFLLFLKLRKPSGDRWVFPALGLVVGCGLMAKYSFAFPVVAVAATCLAVRPAREALMKPALGWSVLVCLVVVAPHGAWLAGEFHATAQACVEQVSRGPQEWAWHVSLLELLKAVVLFLSPFWLVFLACFGRRLAGSAPGERGGLPSWVLPWFHGYGAVLLASLVGVLLALGGTSFQDRWLLPMLCISPAYAFAAVQSKGGTPARSDRPFAAFATVAALLATAVIAATVVRVLLPDLTGEGTRFNMPYDQVAETVRETFEPQAVLAGTNHIAGNLSHQLGRRVPVSSPEMVLEEIEDRTVLVVYTPRRRNDQALPAALEPLLSDRVPLASPVVRSFPYRHSRRDSLRLGFVEYSAPKR